MKPITLTNRIDVTNEELISAPGLVNEVKNRVTSGLADYLIGHMHEGEFVISVTDQLATDCISRKDAIDAIDGLPNCYNGFSDSYDKAYIIGVLEELPSAEPRCIANIQLSQEQLDEAFEKVKTDILSVKPKTGEWVRKRMSINCSVCHKCSWSICFEDTVRRFNYCPNCGARMEGEAYETD